MAKIRINWVEVIRTILTALLGGIGGGGAVLLS